MDIVIGVKSTKTYIRMKNILSKDPGLLLHNSMEHNSHCIPKNYIPKNCIPGRGIHILEGSKKCPEGFNCIYNTLFLQNKQIKINEQGKTFRFDRTGWWAHRCPSCFSLYFSAFLWYIITKYKWVMGGGLIQQHNGVKQSQIVRDRKSNNELGSTYH